MRPSATFWRRLIAALERTRFHTLVRHVDVRIVMPRSMRRLARVLHAFGPLSAALVQLAGGGAREGCFEDELGLGAPVVVETEQFVRTLELALEERRIPYAMVGADLIDDALAREGWVVVPCTGALEPAVMSAVLGGLAAGRRVGVGPYMPRRDAAMLPLPSPPELPASALIRGDRAAIESAVDRELRAPGATHLDAEPPEVSVTLHRDVGGAPAVLFVMNPSEHDVDARVSTAGARSAVDAIDGTQVRAEGSHFAVHVRRRSVCMLELFCPS